MVANPRSTSLWRHPNFLILWSAQATSLVGSQVSTLALPLLAALTLEATALQMGLLAAAGALPSLLIGVFAGVWVDRQRRRPLLIAADLGRVTLLLSIPLTAALGALRIEYLYVIALLVGSFTVLFDVAHQSLLPSLVGRERVIEGNSKLELSRSAAEVGGPGLAGGLVQVLTPPLAILVDALSFLLSALLLKNLRGPETAPAHEPNRRVWKEIGAGLQAVVGNPLLRPLGLGTATVVGFSSLLEAVFVLYLTRELGFTPLAQGLVFTIGNVGFLVGALVAERIARRFGIGLTLMGALVILGTADLIVPVAGLAPLPAAPLLVGAQFCFGLALVVYNITAISLRQTLTSDRLLGRTNASIRLLTQGIVPLGAIGGGILGEHLGLRPTLLIGALGELTAILWLIFSPLRQLGPGRDHPALNTGAIDKI